jgi:hypothetical protein
MVYSMARPSCHSTSGSLRLSRSLPTDFFTEK